MASKKQTLESLNNAQGDGNAKQVLNNAPLSQEAVHQAHLQEKLHGAQHAAVQHVHAGK